MFLRGFAGNDVGEWEARRYVGVFAGRWNSSNWHFKGRETVMTSILASISFHIVEQSIVSDRRFLRSVPYLSGH